MKDRQRLARLKHLEPLPVSVELERAFSEVEKIRPAYFDEVPNMGQRTASGTSYRRRAR